MKHKDEAMLELEKFLDDEDLFGPMREVHLLNDTQELNGVLGKTTTERNIIISRLDF